MTFISVITRKRIACFWGLRRSRYALLAVGFLFFFSLPANFIASSKPLMVFYRGQLFFPVAFDYQGKDFGQDSVLPPDYKAIRDHLESHGWVVAAPISWGSNESNLRPPRYPSPPSRENWLGTDNRGRDVFVRLLYGFRMSMIVALFSLFVAAVFGVVVGGLQGFLGGKIDLIGQRLVEVWNALPALFILIFISHLFTPSVFILMLCLSSFLWVSPQYFIRGECLKTKSYDFVLAAKSLGATKGRVFWSHVMPNSLTPLITLAPFIMNQAILSLSFLDYLGLGVPAPGASLGELLRQGKDHILQSWWLTVYPLATLSFTLLMLNFIGDGIREAFDPRSYSS